MALTFSQEEIEEALADRIPHGMRVEIARRTGISDSYIKRQFNPNDETQSCVFNTLRIACAIDEIDAEIGDKFWTEIEQFRELSKRSKRSTRSSVNHGIGLLQKEIAELVIAALNGKSFSDQMSELLDVENVLDGIKRTMIDAYNTEKNEPGQFSAGIN